ncbi:hypothetical protein K443DRAFT_477771 [Laccaria amethystina LaAM-08-1]|uniref:Uncharacterized protein n=1 Tax=Laccaria amethystina LaAM-08-1 TaxID=1095629 RepID=A0A0C9X517_9AGAR|nr:hypothetical protein K443DRAFT_477771 [Laccaria amethystina LaAM-08-1]
MERWAGVNYGERDLRVRSAGFQRSTSIRGEVYVRGTIEIVFLRLLSHQQKKLNPRRRHLRARSSRIVAVVKGLQFDSGIDIGLEEEGENPDVIPQCLGQGFFSPFALRIHPST